MKKSKRGFTLAEVAVVIVIIGIAMSMGLKVLTATMSNASYSDTKAKQEKIKTALISFLRTNGRLPCPDNTGGIATGVEANVAGVPTCVASAAAGYGVVPWQTLGLSRAEVVDGWGNLFSYSVANFVPAPGIPTAIPVPAGVTPTPPLLRFNNQNWTSATAAGAFDVRSFANAPTVAALSTAFLSFLIQNRDPAPGPNDESRNAIVVIVSHGKNGFGAKTTKVAARLGTVGAGADEKLNAAIGSPTFIRRGVTDDPASPGGAYDDVVTYMSPQDLLQPLMTEGSLRSCQSYCAPAAANCVPAAAPPVGSQPATCP